MSTVRLFAGCGVIKRRDGTEEVVVAGGWEEEQEQECSNTVVIYSIKEKQMEIG
jgi:hypothetical protein